jgi:hypothetical protein
MAERVDTAVVCGVCVCVGGGGVPGGLETT